MNKTEGLKPERVFYFFEELTKIPRCSFDEKRVSDYLKSVGEGLGLETIQDEALNIIIKKPGSKGYESKPTVIIQGHMDMVCDRSEGFDIDFSRDPIPFEVRDGLIMAPNTTLGADNGIAVAMGLAILEDKTLEHPPLEVLITTNEESGMTGAAQLDKKNLSGKILINIDSEEEGKLLVSCAGGKRFSIEIPVNFKVTDKTSFTLKVSGLKGGHSGMEIDKGRGNSNRLLARALDGLREIDYDLCHIEGGSKSNVIPRLSSAIICLADSDIEKARVIVNEMEKHFKGELSTSDPDVTLTLEKTKDRVKAFEDTVKLKIIAALLLVPNGVNSMSMDIEGLVESSNNMGVVSTLEDKVVVENAIRSSVKSLKDMLSRQMEIIAESLGANWSSSGEYPAWQYRKDSYIRDLFAQTYREISGKEMEIEAIHAGLECGLFYELLGDIDMVSLGPDMWGVHAPGERLSIDSVERTYNILVEVLSKIN
ncbi:aminoacyl-histidine dipeptidase [Gudongella oleilytica]|uniref:aminoacyl-histidine dipeptidase n=1 Tax=Gudongella oleilytica TaxID=1582259 RepID=UPI002A369AA4|nr:aminoacyl-histidine dipeptidase [Gudongella oleilytica]MDY0257046.1 aminoacyl-histidine dipeptidase [Gudongella oleilytica]